MKQHYYEFPIMHKIWDMKDAPDDMDKRSPSDKWDGHTCSCLYSDGVLQTVVDQGDGVFGEDVTERARRFVPESIPMGGLVQVTGEMVSLTNAPSDALYTLCGAKQCELEFIAFDVQPHPYALWSESLQSLDKHGFKTVLTYHRDEYPKDGIVYRIDDNAVFEQSDYGQFAMKFYP